MLWTKKRPPKRPAQWPADTTWCRHGGQGQTEASLNGAALYRRGVAWEERKVFGQGRG